MEGVAQVHEAGHLLRGVGVDAPPSWRGSFASTPTGTPSMRASAVTRGRRSSARARTPSRGRSTSASSSAHVVRSCAARAGSATAALPRGARARRLRPRRQLPHRRGRYERKRRSCEKRLRLARGLVVYGAAAAGVDAMRRRALPWSPRGPSARRTTGGPGHEDLARPAHHHREVDAATRAAPRPATGPSAAATTGTRESSSTETSQSGL
jgi:hypothetical protein